MSDNRDYRWNFEDAGAGQILRCENNHDKGEKCYYELMTVEDAELMTGKIAKQGVEIAELKSERDELRAQVAELKASAVVPDESKHHAVMQAQMWAQEARTQKAIVKQIGEIVGCANDWEMVEAVRDALSNASGGSLRDCCCGETEQAWRLCPLHSAPLEQEVIGDE